MLEYQVIYGWKLKAKDIQLFTNVSDDDMENDYQYRLQDLIDVDKKKHPRILKQRVDFEHSDSFDTGDWAVLLGIELNKGKGHYHGCASIPEVSNEHIELLEQFLLDLPALNHITPCVWVFMNTNI